MKIPARTVTYRIHYTYPTCFDDGDVCHIQSWENSSRSVEAQTDQEAQLATFGAEFHQAEYCYHGRVAHPTRIEKTVNEETEDGWQRVTTTNVPLPSQRQCPCGRKYWPIKGETACHELRPAKEA